MKSLKWLSLFLGLTLSQLSFAHDGHGHGHGGYYHCGGYYHGGVYFGLYDPYFYGPLVYPPYAYYPPVATVPAQPSVYVEQNTNAAPPVQAQAPSSGSYWYHCKKPDGFYPYVKECPAGWEKVSPTPPNMN